MTAMPSYGAELMVGFAKSDAVKAGERQRLLTDARASRVRGRGAAGHTRGRAPRGQGASAGAEASTAKTAAK
jgi:hypothetical protein